MTDQIIDCPAGEGLESSRVTAEMLAEPSGVEPDVETMLELDWVFDEAGVPKWRRSSAEEGRAGPAPVVTVKRRRVSVPLID